MENIGGEIKVNTDFLDFSWIWSLVSNTGDIGNTGYLVWGEREEI